MADVFAELRAGLVPVPPDPEFTTALRARLERALALPRGVRPMTTVSEPQTAAGPRGAAVPYLAVRDARSAIDWYVEVFGASVVGEPIVMPDGRIGHAELALADGVIYLADEHPEIGVVSPETLGGTPVSLYLHVADVDAAYARAVAAGAASERPPGDEFHGNRNARIRDPFGHRWLLTQPIEAVSAEEMARRAPDYTVTADAVPGAPPEAVGQLGYFTLSSPDVDRAAAFYTALFGWHFGPSGPGSTGQTYSHVDNTSVPFGIHDAMDDPSPHHYYRVEDLQAMIVRVRELGGEVVSVDEYASGGSARCRDDQGVEFDLWQPAPGY